MAAMILFHQTKLIRKIFLLVILITLSFGMAAQERETETPGPQPPPEASVHQHAIPSIDIGYLKAVQGVQYSLPFCDYLFGHIDEIPEFSDHLFDAFTQSQYHIAELFHYTNAVLSSKAGGYGPPLPGTWSGTSIKTEADMDAFLESEVVDVIHPEAWNKLPFQFRKGIIEFLLSVDRAKTIIDEYTHPVISHLNLETIETHQQIFEKLMCPWNNRELINWETIESVPLADEKKLSYASRIVSEKLNWFFSQTHVAIPDDFSGCSIITGMGECLINGSGNDTISDNKFCVIETGGDDVYLGDMASPESINQPVGIVIDLKGNDHYLCEDGFLVAGVLGLAFLLDLDGDDFYRTNQPGLAFSLFGTSLLYDLNGDDIYIAEGSNALASSYVGTSLFIDASGTDTYSSASYSQGFGGTKGVSVFYDGNGDDQYNTKGINPSTKEPQTNFVQGAAKGRWAEATDGQSLAGGIGIFLDQEGTDTYQATGFSQGASYYFGLGIFSDKQGIDTYNSTSHSQGYAAHYALAAFVEKSGDDRYNSDTDPEKITQIMGSGRDNAAGLFIDQSGDDTYHFGNRSAGIGDLNGIGLLYDMGGDDIYYWHKNRMNAGDPSLGKTIEKSFGIGLGFQLIKPNHDAMGLFYDSTGEGIND